MPVTPSLHAEITVETDRTLDGMPVFRIVRDLPLPVRGHHVAEVIELTRDEALRVESALHQALRLSHNGADARPGE